MNKTSIVSQLNRYDIDRLKGYRELLDFYHGRQWEGRERRGEKRLTFNYAKVFIFNSGDYTATIQLAGSYKVYLEGIALVRNLPAAEMALGRKVALIFFDEHNAKDAVVAEVYT